MLGQDIIITILKLFFLSYFFQLSAHIQLILHANSLVLSLKQQNRMGILRLGALFFFTLLTTVFPYHLSFPKTVTCFTLEIAQSTLLKSQPQSATNTSPLKNDVQIKIKNCSFFSDEESHYYRLLWLEKVTSLKSGNAKLNLHPAIIR